MRAVGCALKPEQAQAIYFAGEQAVVERLCALHAQLQAGQQEIEALRRKLAQQSKDSSNSSKPPSSDDITKPKKGGGQAPKAPGQGNHIGAQPGHPRRTRAPYPPETISRCHPHESSACPHCGGEDMVRIEVVPPRITQQSEIKEIVVTREEHRAYPYWCAGCGETHYAC